MDSHFSRTYQSFTEHHVQEDKRKHSKCMKVVNTFPMMSRHLYRNFIPWIFMGWVHVGTYKIFIRIESYFNHWWSIEILDDWWALCTTYNQGPLNKECGPCLVIVLIWMPIFELYVFIWQAMLLWLDSLPTYESLAIILHQWKRYTNLPNVVV